MMDDNKFYPNNEPRPAIQKITPVGDDSVIEALEKARPYTIGQARMLEDAQLEAYKNRK